MEGDKLRADQLSIYGEFFRDLPKNSDIKEEIKRLKDQIYIFLKGEDFEYVDEFKERFYNFLSMEFFYDIRRIKISLMEELKAKLSGENKYFVKLRKMRDGAPYHIIINFKIEYKKSPKRIILQITIRPTLYYKVISLNKKVLIDTEEELSFLIDESSTLMDRLASALALETLKKPRPKYDYPTTLILIDTLKTLKLNNINKILGSYLARITRNDEAAAVELRKLIEHFFYDLLNLKRRKTKELHRVESNMSKVFEIYDFPQYLKNLTQSITNHIYKGLSEITHKAGSLKSKETHYDILKKCNLYYKIFEILMLEILNYVNYAKEMEVFQNEPKK